MFTPDLMCLWFQKQESSTNILATQISAPHSESGAPSEGMPIPINYPVRCGKHAIVDPFVQER